MIPKSSPCWNRSERGQTHAVLHPKNNALACGGVGVCSGPHHPICDHNIGTGLLVSLSIAATLFIGFLNLDVAISTWLVIAVAFCLELVVHVGLLVLEFLVLMLGGFLMTLVGRQLRRALDHAANEAGQRTVARRAAPSPFLRHGSAALVTKSSDRKHRLCISFLE